MPLGIARRACGEGRGGNGSRTSARRGIPRAAVEPRLAPWVPALRQVPRAARTFSFMLATAAATAVWFASRGLWSIAAFVSAPPSNLAGSGSSLFAAPAPTAAVTRSASFLDGIFGPREPVPVPAGFQELTQNLQDCMLTSVEKGLPRVDFELPRGLRLGIDPPFDEDGPEPPLVPPVDLSPADVALAEREFAAAFVLMFDGLKNGQNLCVLFRTNKMATAARKAWGDFGKVRVTSFPTPKTLGNRIELLAKQVNKRPWVVAVAPNEKQLEELRAFETLADKKLILFLLNSRIRGRRSEERGLVRDYMADACNPAFTFQFVGPRGDAVLYHQLGKPWVVSRANAGASRGDLPAGSDEAAASANARELFRSDDEPKPEDIESAAGVAVR